MSSTQIRSILQRLCENLVAWSAKATLVLFALSFANCVVGPRSGSGGAIDSLHVFAVPVAMDLDAAPGPDAFGITIYASVGGAAKGVAVTTGRLEILMFDGALPAGNFPGVVDAPPRRLWSLTPAELKQSAIKSSLGIGYRLTPGWGDTPPRQGAITAVVRFVPTRGNPIVSAPVTIAVTAK